MLITIDFSAETPIYTQLKDQIITGIAGKALAPGEALPSVRRMAADIGVNVNTVGKAYTILKDEGYITIDRRSGCFVSAEFPPADEQFFRGLREQLLPIAAAAACRSVGTESFQSLCKKIYEELEVRS